MAEKKIRGVEYSVSPMLAKVAIVRFAQLAKVLGPALPELAQAISSASAGRSVPRKGGKATEQLPDGQEIDDSDVAALRAIERIVMHIEPVAFADLVEVLIETAEIKDSNGWRKVIFDQDFSGDLGAALELLTFVLREQYGSFFSGLMATGRSNLTAKH